MFEPGARVYWLSDKAKNRMQDLSVRNREVADHASGISAFRAIAPYSIALLAFWILFLGTITSVTTYLALFTGFSAYDDEGTFMMTVKQYLGGRILYVDVFSFYGPVYYLYNWLLHALTGAPVTHDVVRMTSLVLCLAGALICAWIVLRLTGSLVMAALAHLFTSAAITAFSRSEPGHPQELVLLLLLLFASCPLWADFSLHRNLLMMSVGALAAALLLIKINVGALAMASLALTIAARLPRSPLSQMVRVAAYAGCILLPAVLMQSHFDYGWARLYCFLEMTSIAAAGACVMRLHIKSPQTGVRDGWLVGVGFSLTFAGTLAMVWAQGVSPATLWDSLVLVAGRIFLQSRVWFLQPRFPVAGAEWALAWLLAALYVTSRQPVPGTESWRRLFLFKTAFSFGAMILIPLWMRDYLLSYVSPFAWLVLFNPSDQKREAQAFPRAFLCVLTVLQTIYAFPVAGSQNNLIQVLLFTLVAVCAGDSLVWLGTTSIRSRWPMGEWRRRSQLSLVGVAALYLVLCYTRYKSYIQSPALDLPGAQRVHVTADQRRDLQWLARNIRQTCDAFEALPGMPSLNFWSGVYPLTGQNMDNWMATFTDSQQKAVIAALAPHARACIVYNPTHVKFWGTKAEILESLPLAKYIRENFRTFANSGDYELMIRNERDPHTVHVE